MTVHDVTQAFDALEALCVDFGKSLDVATPLSGKYISLAIIFTIATLLVRGFEVVYAAYTFHNFKNTSLASSLDDNQIWIIYVCLIAVAGLEFVLQVSKVGLTGRRACNKKECCQLKKECCQLRKNRFACANESFSILSMIGSVAAYGLSLTLVLTNSEKFSGGDYLYGEYLYGHDEFNAYLYTTIGRGVHILLSIVEIIVMSCRAWKLNQKRKLNIQNDKNQIELQTKGSNVNPPDSEERDGEGKSLCLGVAVVVKLFLEAVAMGILIVILVISLT